ncbi:plasmid mobilization protein [Lactococcus lactis]|uniref:plasmid mobilization protein n=1 Tax=Lactococcus lactis TaxID=1358 RepID=UPI00289159D6|nr:plasmid mobilization relaxosome protein MobC [Lactococcus lactis]MDT2869073.1 plasmid mobilization relaxosome protein MobC [Lactococcus lactis]MDT2898734.1 plasmid mobilization relaxosome protein MobC [Lactococcus lactis]
MGTERFRDKQIKIWTTEKEKQQLEKNMRQSGYGTMGGYLRKMGLEGIIIKVDFSEIRGTFGEIYSLRTELNKIGNNINQIAKHVNQSKEIDAMDFYILEEEMKGFKTQMEKFEKEVVQTFNKKINELTKED